MRILSHEQPASNGNFIHLSGWVGVSCAPGEIRLIVKLIYPYTKGEVPQPKHFEAIHEYDRTPQGLKNAVVEFLESGAKANDKDVHQAMLYLLPLFN